MISQLVGRALVGGVKIGLGFAGAAGKTALGAAKIAGAGAVGAGILAGKGAWRISKAIGKPLVTPFETAENRSRTAGNYLDLLKGVGNTIVHKNKEGDMRLTKKGMAIIGGMTMATKANDSWFDAKANNLGAVDQRPTTTTPNYNPVKYEMSPSKRINPDSGGATGDLVFALHRLR